ncbi:MAG: HD domain-containing protein, partial [Chthoniobacterales bacterium]|nr:HD domain-containing protein [Chthoniobacterales bacterium]
MTNFGNPYFEVEFVDHEDRLMLRVWDNTNVFNEIRNLQEGEFVEVSGEFSNNPRFGIEGTNWSVRRLEESERKEFLVGSEDKVKGISEDFKFIEGEVKKIRDPRYRELATKFLENYGEEFRRAAAAHSVHHAYRGGLVEHVAHVMKAARRLLEEYRWLNSDLLITGILFHDCGKIVECCPRKEELRISQNLVGELLGHISIGIEIVNRLWKELKLDEYKDVSPNNHLARVYLLHLIASHHGALEYGSPVMPKIPEAYVLHYLDNMDAKLEIFREIHERE